MNETLQKPLSSYACMIGTRASFGKHKLVLGTMRPSDMMTDYFLNVVIGPHVLISSFSNVIMFDVPALRGGTKKQPDLIRFDEVIL